MFKTFTEMHQSLYEAKGMPTEIKIGDTFKTKIAKTKIINIYVSGTHGKNPSTYFEYEYEVFESGKKGKEKNDVKTFLAGLAAEMKK
jgi:hypothetical protein